MPFQPTWNSIRTHMLPQWFRDAKFGIYTHWGVYSVPATGPNGTWYPYNMYRPQMGNYQYLYHREKYGPAEKFGYKDFIPMFTAEHFDADEWAEMFAGSGAQFAGPVAEHHDGFSMWDSKVNEWNAKKMGPKRDVVGELAKAIRGKDMRYMVALHHAENWWFFNHDSKYDTSDPKYSGLYGDPHDIDMDVTKIGFDPAKLERPDQKYLEKWLDKTKEVIDGYQPDLIWFDFGIRYIQEHYKRAMLAHYYGQAEQWGKEVVVTYKNQDLVPGSGLIDLELGRFNDLTYMEWITDTTVDDGSGWCFLNDNTYKPPTEVVHYLIENVCKNGYLLLNVDPMPNGKIPEPSQNTLKEMGKWLQVNGESIYGTTPWMAYGEGPTRMESTGDFTEGEKLHYQPGDYRFTCKDDTLYVHALAWPGKEAKVKTMWEKLYQSEIKSIKMLGSDQELKWKWGEGEVIIETPDTRPCDHSWVFKVERKPPY